MKQNSTQEELRNKIDQNLYVEDLMDSGFDTFCDVVIAVINSEVLSVLDRLAEEYGEIIDTTTGKSVRAKVVGLEDIEAERRKYE